MFENDNVTETQENPAPREDSQNAYYNRVLLQRKMAERRKKMEASNRSLFPDDYATT